MTTIALTFARLIAVPAISVGAILGLASVANAATGPAAPTTTTAPAPVGPGYQYGPSVYAPAAPSQVPGWQGHHGPNHMN